MMVRPLIVLVLACMVAGCDRRDSSSTAESSPPPAPRPAPHTPTEAERYAAYKQKVQPVVDELIGVESLIEHPNTLSFGDVDNRVKAMNAAFTKISPQLTDEDKSHSSYKQLESAMDDTAKAHGCWQEADRARARLNAGELQMSNGLSNLSVSQKGDELTNSFLAHAEVDIVGMNTDFGKNQ